MRVVSILTIWMVLRSHRTCAGAIIPQKNLEVWPAALWYPPQTEKVEESSISPGSIIPISFKLRLQSDLLKHFILQNAAYSKSSSIPNAFADTRCRILTIPFGSIGRLHTFAQRRLLVDVKTLVSPDERMGPLQLDVVGISGQHALPKVYFFEGTCKRSCPAKNDKKPPQYLPGTPTSFISFLLYT